MPKKATESLEAQVSQLKKVAATRLILVVLDGAYLSASIVLISLLSFSFHVVSDMWDAEHERPFAIIDPDTASKLLIVRRM